MDFSLFDEASRDHDAEAADRRTALVRIAVQHEAMPFLALASSDAEYGHRKALMSDRLSTIAARCEASVEEVEGAADRMYHLIRTTRQGSAEGLSRTAAMHCGNCDHGSVDHSEGLQCPRCGCNNFTPKSKTAAREGGGPFS